jgi:hypothetical protein
MDGHASNIETGAGTAICTHTRAYTAPNHHHRKQAPATSPPTHPPATPPPIPALTCFCSPAHPASHCPHPGGTPLAPTCSPCFLLTGTIQSRTSSVVAWSDTAITARLRSAKRRISSIRPTVDTVICWEARKKNLS